MVHDQNDAELQKAAGQPPAGDLARVESAIIELRGERVILDSDLAEIYGVETKRLNERVKRNAGRFGDKYAFQLTSEKYEDLRSQRATSDAGRGGRRYRPWAFQHLKDRLKKQGLENDEIAARVAKLLAEAEKERAAAAKTRAETDKLEFATIVKKLRLLLEVQRAMEHERVDDFLNVLKEMSDGS